MMNKNVTIFLFILIISKTIGKNNKTIKTHHFEKGVKDRDKRAVLDEDKLAWINSKLLTLNDDRKFLDIKTPNIEKYSKFHNDYDEPFWGTRGRRASEESIDSDYPSTINEKHKYNNFQSLPNNQNLLETVRNNRDNVVTEQFWVNRGRRQEDDTKFWGSRGRREKNSNLENKEKQSINTLSNNDGNVNENEPFWGNRGRRNEDEPFWGNRGRRQEDEPFWGNRGRRQDSDPFWGARGRRDDMLPFWGSRGRRQENEPFWGSRGKRNLNFQKDILYTAGNIQDNLPRNKRSENSFWNNRGRESKLKSLFSGFSRLRSQFSPRIPYRGLGLELLKPVEAHSMQDGKIYAEQPHYVVVERSSRSSSEDDPYFISRGKKKNHFLINNAIRSRRGSLEELVKSVRNDPYFLARGKKEDGKSVNYTLYEEFIKGKELICATIELLAIKNGKMKRETDERDRRTILKKLAAQLQNDPFFVSRGKKNGNDLSEENLNEFINNVANMCN